MNRKSFFYVIKYCLILVIFLNLNIGINAQKKPNGKAKKLAADAEKLFNQKDYRNAAAKYAEAITISPNYPAAHFWKGYAHYYLNEYDLALDDLDKALEQGYTPLEVYKIRWYVNAQKKNYDAAQADIQRVLQADPNNANLLLGLGDIYRAQGSNQEAINAYRKVLEIDPNNADVNYFLATSYHNLGDYNSQGAAAEQAIKGNTKFIAEAFYLAGDSNQKANNFDKAIENYERALNLKPDNAEIYNNLTDLYRRQNRFNDAIELTKKRLALFPNDGNLYTSLSWYYSLADRHNDAVIAAQQAIKLLPDQYLGYTSICRALNDTKQYQAAIQACNNALKLNPNDGESSFYIARAYDLMNKPDTATEYYKKAVAGLEQVTVKNPDDSDKFYLLGNAYYADGQRDKAIEAYKKSLSLSPNFAKAHYNLGYIYFLNNDLNSANEQYNALQKIDANLAAKFKQAIEKK